MIILEDYTDDQNERWNRAVVLMMESLHKADYELRACAHDQKCFDELMQIRVCLLDYAKTLRREDSP
jgi:hypothetical protein